MIDDSSTDLVNAYAALRRERRPDDELTSDERRFPALEEPAFGLDATRSRRVRATGGAQAVLVPGDGVVAVIDPGGGAIADVVRLLDGSAVGTAFRGTGRLLVSGVVPDGVQEVTIARRDGSAITVPTDDHLYAVEVLAREPAELPAEVVFVLDGHERRLPVPGADDEVLDFRSPLSRP